VRVEGLSQIGSELENGFSRRIFPSFSEASRTRAARRVKYNEFHDGVRCHTYISRRVPCTDHGQGDRTPLAGTAHGEEEDTCHT